MIDWTEVDKSSPDAWVALAERLLDKAQALLTGSAPDAAALRSAQQDLAQLVEEANLQCPVAALTAARRTSDQLTRALTALSIADLESRNDRLDAVKARMSSAANELRAEASRLRLEPVKEALRVATEAALKAKDLVGEVRALKKEQIPARIEEIVARIEEIVRLIGRAI
jgi:hypothetical protein